MRQELGLDLPLWERYLHWLRRTLNGSLGTSLYGPPVIEVLKGMMPYTRLHIVATGEDGLPKPFEAELTYQQVIDLAEKAEKAKSKLKVLRQSVETWLPGCLPDLPLTRTPSKESSDV